MMRRDVSSSSEMKSAPFKVTSPAIEAADPDSRTFEWQAERKAMPASVPRVRLQWPEGIEARRDLFKAWHAIAMQVAGKHFRVLAVLWRFIHWKTGTFYPSDRTLAECAGKCSIKTISREVALYKRLGILDVETKGVKDRDGKLVTTRVLYPTIPKVLPSSISVVLGETGMDTW